MNISGTAIPLLNYERDFGHFSDHVTVWVDKHIGVQNTYDKFKSKFNDNIQILQSNNLNEMEIDDMSALCTDPDLFKNLADEVYCLKYFSTVQEGLDYINENAQRKIFFISSGTIGRDIVPKIASLSQIQGIYIFCGNISKQTDWANDYAEQITAMLEHHDDLLVRLARDIAVYLEQKGDQYKIHDQITQAKNCYAWSKKLLVRAKQLGDRGATKLIEKLTRKIDEMQSPTECLS